MDPQEIIGTFIGMAIVIFLFVAFLPVLASFGIFPMLLFIISTIALLAVVIYSLVRK